MSNRHRTATWAIRTALGGLALFCTITGLSCSNASPGTDGDHANDNGKAAEPKNSLSEAEAERKKSASVDLQKYSKVEERIIRALDDETEFEFVDLPLTDVLEYLKQQHNIQIILDEQALLDEGIQPDEPINMSLSGISLRSALKIILEPLALTYVIQGEVMRITSETKAEEMMSALRPPPPI